MLILAAKIRKPEEKVAVLRKKGELPGVLYGPKIKNESLRLDYKSFEKIYKQSGLSTLITLLLQGKKIPILIHSFQKDPLTGKFLHVDFYQPRLEEKIEAKVPLVFEGKSKAVKDLEGTLIKHIQELEVKAIPQNLPKEIKVNIESLETFEDDILVKDLSLPKGVEVLRGLDEVIASVSPPEKVEEELEKPAEEKVEEAGEKKEEEGKEEEKKEEKEVKEKKEKE